MTLTERKTAKVPWNKGKLVRRRAIGREKDLLEEAEFSWVRHLLGKSQRGLNGSAIFPEISGPKKPGRSRRQGRVRSRMG